MARIRFRDSSRSFVLTGSEESIERRLRAMFAPTERPSAEPKQEAPSNELLEEFAQHLRADPPRGLDIQRAAALRAAAFLAERGIARLRVADFVRALIKARVDTKDVFTLLETLTAEGLLVRAREGGPYRFA